jgi:hypothetical protein
MSTSTPDVIEWLYEHTKAAFAADGRVVVFDGPPTQDVDKPDAIGIAVNTESGGDGPGQAGVSFALASQLVSVDLACVVHVWTGDSGLSAPRRRAFALFDQMTALLDDLRGEFGVVDARIPDHTYTPIREETGLSVLLEFVVHLDLNRKD